jgi:hypothetical protein
MSAHTWPALPGLLMRVSRDSLHNFDVHESISGKEQRVSWESTPRYRYRITYEFLRDNVSAPSPFGAYSELDAVIYIVDQCRGGWDFFAYTDPVDGTSRNVRLDGDLQVTKEADQYWTASLSFVSVK